jgi:hypothetical protein
MDMNVPEAVGFNTECKAWDWKQILKYCIVRRKESELGGDFEDYLGDVNAEAKTSSPLK